MRGAEVGLCDVLQEVQILDHHGPVQPKLFLKLFVFFTAVFGTEHICSRVPGQVNAQEHHLS